MIGSAFYKNEVKDVVWNSEAKLSLVIIYWPSPIRGTLEILNSAAGFCQIAKGSFS